MPDINELSEREREILHLVATGASNKEIARTLFISTNTVKVHLRNIFAKIGVTSRTEAAMFAVNSGLVETGLDQEGKSATSLILEGQIPAGFSLDKLEKSKKISRKAAFGLFASVIVLSVVAFYIIRIGRTSSQNAFSPQLAASQERWKENAPLTMPRSGLAAVAYENQIYAIGGENGQTVTNLLERYDSESNDWVTLQSKPTAVTDINAAVVGGKIYVPGGRTSSGKPTSVLEIYDPGNNAWETGEPLPVALSAYALVPFEGKLYLFGGWDGQRYLNSVLEYDPALGKWNTCTPMPTPRGNASAAVSGGKVYIIGGYDGESALRVNEVYLPDREGTEENPWGKVKPLPLGRYSMGTAVVADIIHVIGGKGEPGKTLHPTVYFPQDDKWLVSEDNLSASWSGLGLVTIETQLFAIGGLLNGLPSAQNVSFQAIYTISLPLLVR